MTEVFFFFLNFADCSDVVRVKKKSRFCPAVGGVSNKQHPPLVAGVVIIAC